MTIQLTWPRIGSPGTQTSELKHWRIAWADPEAHATWEPRFQRLITLSVEVEKSMIADSIVDASVLRADESEVAALIHAVQKMGLIARPVAARKQAGPNRERRLVCDLLLARSQTLAAALSASEQIGTENATRFGIPPCCSQNALVSPFQFPVAGEPSQTPSPLMLLAVLGLGPFRHSPCTPACAETNSAVQQFLDFAAARDPEAAGWYLEMSAWDVHWSRVAGLVEIRTPVFRYAYPERGPDLTMTVASTRDEAPPSLPTMRRSVKRAISVVSGTLSSSFCEAAVGEENLRTKLFDGFDCAFAQRSRFTSVIWKWAKHLRGGEGDILHIPGGDGSLLQLAKEVNPRLRLFGFDDRADAADLARHRLKEAMATFGKLDDMEREMHLWSCAPGRAAFVDPEYLATIPTADRQRLVERLVQSFDIVIMYATDRARDKHGTVSALMKALGIPAKDDDACSTTVSVAK